MRRVTRNIAPAQARDLLERLPRACLAYADGGEPRLEPVTVLSDGDHYLVGMPPAVTAAPSAGAEVVLLVDEGSQFFDLRAIYLRGQVLPAEAAPDRREDLRWFAVEPKRTVAWDYGRMRYADDET